MPVRKTIVALLVGAVSFGAAGVTASDGAVRAKSYKNCKALNSVYPHGVGRKGARDKTSGKPVTNFKVSTKIYRLNRRLDRDHDGIACEKR